jgi:hypothetical protein
MKWELFRELIDQFSEKKISRRRFIDNWRLVQRYLGAAS